MVLINLQKTDALTRSIDVW